MATTLLLLFLALAPSLDSWLEGSISPEETNGNSDVTSEFGSHWDPNG
jgi:hypothetical protein